jgi:hypothetical protein
MVQANESAMRSGARELGPSSLRPTVYRPSRPSAIGASNGDGSGTSVFRGPALARAGIWFRGPNGADNIVAVRVPAAGPEEMVELRIPRVLTDRPQPTSQYTPSSDAQLANAMLLPAGWYLLGSSVATVVSQTSDGRTRVEFDAPPDGTSDVVLTLRHG